jgi:hypothetical protein
MTLARSDSIIVIGGGSRVTSNKSLDDSASRLWGFGGGGERFRNAAKIKETFNIILCKSRFLSQKGVCSTSLHSLYLWCDMSTNPKNILLNPAIFFTKK